MKARIVILVHGGEVCEVCCHNPEVSVKHTKMETPDNTPCTCIEFEKEQNRED